MIFGYGRVSTRDQNLNLQEDALKNAGCSELFLEKITGTRTDRPELNRLIAQLREGDTVIVWKLDRLGRSLKDLIDLVNQFRSKGVRFKCITMEVDTETASGRLMYNLFAALAEFEHDLIVERTNAGLEAARARGRKGGRPKGLSSEARKKAQYVKYLYADGNSIANIMKITGTKSSHTIYRWLREQGVSIGKKIS